MRIVRICDTCGLPEDHEIHDPLDDWGHTFDQGADEDYPLIMG